MSKIKFIPRAKRKALEEKLATLDKFSAEAKEIRGKLGWGEPIPPPAPVSVTPVTKPKPKRKYTRKKKTEAKE